MTHPALVIFDMAGTTVEDRGQVPAAFAAALAAHDIALSGDDIMRVRGASKRQAIRSLVPPSHAGRVDAIYATFKEDLTRRYRAGVRGVPGAQRLFGDLRAAGARIALTTGFDRDIAMLLLASLGWTRTAIDAVICGDDVNNGRPAPDMILMAMQLTGIHDAAAVANVGDTTLDLESAARAGVKWNIGVLTGAHGRAELLSAPHTHIVPSVADIQEVWTSAARVTDGSRRSLRSS
jgi:phosphonatase-like hydrolase